MLTCETDTHTHTHTHTNTQTHTHTHTVKFLKAVVPLGLYYKTFNVMEEEAVNRALDGSTYPG